MRGKFKESHISKHEDGVIITLATAAFGLRCERLTESLKETHKNLMTICKNRKTDLYWKTRSRKLPLSQQNSSNNESSDRLLMLRKTNC